ncbi:MAG: sodium:solute symporter, partial [Victivallaceae bacterium]
MNLGLLDVVIVTLVLTVVLASGILTGRLVKSVSDFLAANRCAGRYLLCVAQGMAGLGAISMAAYFEQYYQAGFAVQWWGFMTTPVMLLISLSGWVIYRFRETRAMTLAQFFEMRYGRRFRIFSGMVIWVSGVLNYGIFPGVTARFLIAFGGLPATVELGPVAISTYPLTMALMLGIALVLTLNGGQVAVMISDFVQGLLMMVIMLAIIAVLFHKFSYGEIAASLINAPPGASPVNPFDQATDKIRDFNVFFFIMMVLINIYTYRAWQGGQGYSCSAKSAHEARMAGIIGEWRGQIITLSFLMIPICAWVLMHNSNFAADAAAVRSSLERFGDPQTANQMLVPTALSRMLPAGLMGCFFAVIIMMAVSTDDT